jgi:hypothetical protein
MASPLFLLAPPRSYTSLVNAMLGQHPQAFGLPELCLFNGRKLKDLWIRETDEIENHGKTRQGLQRAVAELYAGEQTSAAVTMASHWCIRRQDWTTAEVYRELVARIDPLVPVEKSPSYTISVKRMQAMLEAFPDARFLHLTRHPVGQCKSVMSLNEGAFAVYVNSIEFQADRAIVDPQYCWHDLNANILNFLQSVPPQQQMHVRGEDIMGDPRNALASICRWLGIRDDDQAVSQMMHPERSPFACFGPINALFGNDPNFLSGPTFRPHTVKLAPLHQPVPWRTDGKGLRPEVIGMAREFGYGGEGERPVPPAGWRPHIGAIDGDPVTSHPDLSALSAEQIAFREALLRRFKETKVKQFVKLQTGYISPEDMGHLPEDAIEFLFDEHGRPPANAPIEDIVDKVRKSDYDDRWLTGALKRLKVLHEQLTLMEGEALDRISGLPVAANTTRFAEAAPPKLDWRDSLQNVVMYEFRAKKQKKFVEKNVTNIHTNVMIIQGAKVAFDDTWMPQADDQPSVIVDKRRQVRHLIEWFEAAQMQVRSSQIRLREIESQALEYARRGYLNAVDKKSKSQ